MVSMMNALRYVLYRNSKVLAAAEVVTNTNITDDYKVIITKQQQQLVSVTPFSPESPYIINEIIYISRTDVTILFNTDYITLLCVIHVFY
jgi:hypothetical protein